MASGDESTGKGLLVKADAIASNFHAEILSSLSSSSTTSPSPQSPQPQEQRRKPKLVGILSTSSAPSRAYANATRRQCEAFGIEFQLRETGAAAQEGLGEGEGVEEAIIEANEDEEVDGIMVSGASL